MQQKTLITGATGFIGSQVVLALKARGDYLIAMLRREQAGAWDELLLHDFAESITEVHRESLSGVETVFHLAGLAHDIDGSVAGSGPYFRINTQATVELARLAAECGVNNFVFLSSVKAMGEPLDEEMTEQTRCVPCDPYGESKLAAEKSLLDLANKVDMKITIIRPVLVYGPGVKGNLFSMLKGISGGYFPPLPASDCKRSMVSVYDVISAMMMVEKKPETDKQVYIVTDNERYDARGIYDLMRANLGLSLNRFSIPMRAFLLLAECGDFLQKFLPVNVPFTSRVWRKLFGPAEYSSAKIRRELGWESKHSLALNLPAMACEYQRAYGLSDESIEKEH